MDAREEMGLAIANCENQVKRMDDYSYLVASQSGKGDYEILKSPIGWACSYPDNQKREVKWDQRDGHFRIAHQSSNS